MKLTFLGATDTVTGSRFLLEREGTRILVDCGLFQGVKKVRQRNWSEFPVRPDTLSAIVLTHAHIDHSGYVPVLIKQGYAGPIYCTPATGELCGILLPDAAHLQEEDAADANRFGYSKHRPALPLYTPTDARLALRDFKAVQFGESFAPAPGFTARFTPAGHILGAACVHIEVDGRRTVFSGDVGRPADPVMHPPRPIERADYLVVESTYGDRRHPGTDPAVELAEIVTRVAGRGGTLVIPSFAVGRAQVVLHLLTTLMNEGRAPKLPVYLDSPMAINATELFCRYHDQHRLSAEQCGHMCDRVVYARTVEDSRAAIHDRSPKIILSASGMATGGRILHHLKATLGDPRNCVVFVGFQATGTRGAALLTGAESVKIHGAYHRVRAEVVCIENLSAHADYRELIDWLRSVREPPRRTFVVHGEPGAQDALRLRIADELGWNAVVPDHLEEVELE